MDCALGFQLALYHILDYTIAPYNSGMHRSSIIWIYLYTIMYWYIITMVTNGFDQAIKTHTFHTLQMALALDHKHRITLFLSHLRHKLIQEYSHTLSQGLIFRSMH